MTKLKKGGLLLSVAALLSLAGCTSPETGSSNTSTPNPSSSVASSESSVVAPKYDVEHIAWGWEETASGYTATATIPCTNGLPDKVVDATVTSEKTDPTCTVAGSIVYTAKIQFEGKEYKATKKITIDALGHEYDVDHVVWTWTKKADDSGYDVSAKIPCKRGDDEVVVNDIAVTSKRTEPTCTEDGSIVYTATGTYNGQTLTSTQTDPLEKTGHSYDYSKATFVWAKVEGGKGYTVVAKVPCSKGDDTKDVTAEVAETNRIPATCEKDGSVTYTATIKDEQNKAYTDTHTDTLAKLGHDYDYDNIKWDWVGNAEDGYTAATATVTCSRDQAKTSADATVSVQTTKEATCEEAGKKVYTAKATFNGTEYSSTQEVILPALGHNLTLVKAKDASISATGNSAYYKCDRCGKLFSDAKGTTEISAVPTISWVHVAAIDPTQSARGFKEFYLKSGTGEVSFTAPENATCSTITLTDEEKASFINNDTNKVTIPSFDELDAMYSGHEGTMPYDGPFLTKAAAAYDLYSDTAKTAYGKDVDAMLTAFNAAYEVANPMDKISSGWDGKLLDSSAAYEDSTLGTVRHFVLKEGNSTLNNAYIRIDKKTTVSDDTKALVVFVKGIADANLEATVNQPAASQSGYRKLRMSGAKEFGAFGDSNKDPNDFYCSSMIDYIADGWYAFYFTNTALFEDLNNSTGDTTQGTSMAFWCNWGANNIYISSIYAIKKSNYYGNDVAAFPNTADLTQNYNNATYSYGRTVAGNVGDANLYNPLLGTYVVEGKGGGYNEKEKKYNGMAFEIGYAGANGVNAKKGVLKKMVEGTLTSAYFYFYSSVDTTITADFRYYDTAWTAINYNYSFQGKGWHKVTIDNAKVLAALNEADGTKAGYLWFNVKGQEALANKVLRMTGLYGTLAA